MKRPIKPFVVEVRKGQKNQKKTPAATEPQPFGLSEPQPRESDALRRAEAALFGAFGPKPESAARPGRILETIPDEAPEPVEAFAIEGKRRGRPPGSRNKPREDAEAAIPATTSDLTAAPKRRGRPPRVLEGSVRKVELTPELASAALESIAKASVARAPLPTRPGPRRSELRPVRPVKEPGRRGRPPKAGSPKEKPVREKVAKERAPIAARTGGFAPEIPAAPAFSSWAANPLDAMPRLIRIAKEQAGGDPAALLGALRRPRAGELWKRRLRGAALVAYERRLKKSGAAPR